MKRRHSILFVLLFFATLSVVFLLVQPRITYHDRTLSLAELNSIRAPGKAEFCVQQVNALSHFIGMSFDYHCFDNQAEAEFNMSEVRRQVEAFESP